MKTTKILFWVFNGLLCAMMLFSAYSYFGTPEEMNKIVVGHFQYPPYFMGLLSTAKILAIIVILIPGFPRLKEWAYAGFAFDLVFLIYSMMALHDPSDGYLFMSPFIVVFVLAYYFHIKKQRAVATGGNG
ncbi:MAG: DoxX family protein [Mucilaginibacter sp.]